MWSNIPDLNSMQAEDLQDWPPLRPQKENPRRTGGKTSGRIDANRVGGLSLSIEERAQSGEKVPSKLTYLHQEDRIHIKYSAREGHE